jgi:hypothetical protein
MLPKTPESDFKRDANNPLVEAIMNYDFVHVEAYVVHVDMVLRNEVAYKLTKDTIEALVDFHKEVYCVDAKANTCDWMDKEWQCKKLHDDFIQDINKFVFRTHVSALEGLEGDGAGELLCGKSEEVKNNIGDLMKPLLPPLVERSNVSENTHCGPELQSVTSYLVYVPVLQFLSPASADPGTNTTWVPMMMSFFWFATTFPRPDFIAGYF